MKKVIISLVLLLACITAIYVWNAPRYTKADTIYLNANDAVSYARLQKLAHALNKEGYRTIVSTQNNFKSGLFNIYAANNNQQAALPPVVDSKAINLLWVPAVVENQPEPLRAYDVIVVENMSSFLHLKAVNVRTAYIPEAIDIISVSNKKPQNKIMYYGDATAFSLALYLVGTTNLTVDLFGKGFEKNNNQNKFVKEAPKASDFTDYSLILIDQSDEEIAQELINQRIITAIENGGLPYIRYNNGVAKIFGNKLPMYANEQEFLPKAQMFLNNPVLIAENKEALRQIAHNWNTQSQAKKFTEILEIMKKKMK